MCIRDSLEAGQHDVPEDDAVGGEDGALAEQGEEDEEGEGEELAPEDGGPPHRAGEPSGAGADGRFLEEEARDEDEDQEGMEEGEEADGLGVEAVRLAARADVPPGEGELAEGEEGPEDPEDPGFAEVFLELMDEEFHGRGKGGA